MNDLVGRESKTRRSGRWSGSEIAELRRMHAYGLKPTEIGCRLGRSRQSVRSKMSSLKMKADKYWDRLEPLAETGREGDYTQARRESMNNAFVEKMEQAGYVRFSANGPPDIVFREAIWRGAA